MVTLTWSWLVIEKRFQNLTLFSGAASRVRLRTGKGSSTFSLSWIMLKLKLMLMLFLVIIKCLVSWFLGSHLVIVLDWRWPVWNQMVNVSSVPHLQPDRLYVKNIFDHICKYQVIGIWPPCQSPLWRLLMPRGPWMGECQSYDVQKINNIANNHLP